MPVSSGDANEFMPQRIKRFIMKRPGQSRYGPVLFFAALSAVVYKNFVLFWQPPFPGRFLQAWYEPWRSLHFEDGIIQLSNKPVADDVFRHILPFRLLGIDLLRQFRLPLWNPYNGSGMPLLATINSGFLDPFNILYALLPTGVAHGIYILLQFILIAVCMYAYLRTLKIRQSASVTGALLYVLSGFVTVRLVFTTYGWAMAGLPLLLALIETFLENRGSRRLFFVPVIFAVMTVSTQTQVVIYVAGLTAAYAAWRFPGNSDRQTVLPPLFLFLTLTVLGFLLAAVQLFPTYELMKLSHIVPGNSQDILDKYLVPVGHMLSVVIPNFFGSDATYNFWGHGDYVQTMASVGFLPVLLALAAFARIPHRTRGIRTFFLATVVTAFLLAIDWRGSRWFYSLGIPVISTGAPSRIFFLSTFGISVLAAMGAEQLYAVRKRTFLQYGVLLATVLFAAASVFVTYRMNATAAACPPHVPDNCRDTAFRNTLFAVGAFYLQLSLLAFVLRRKSDTGLPYRIALAGFFLSIIIPGVYNSYKYTPRSLGLVLFPELPVIRALRTRTADSRVFGFGEANITADLATQLRFFDPQYYHPLYILRYREFLEYMKDGRRYAVLPRGDANIQNTLNVSPAVAARRERLLNLDSVRYRLYKKNELAASPSGTLVWSDPTWLLVASDSALPRAYIVHTADVITDPSAILTRMYAPDFDIRTTAVFETPLTVTSWNAGTGPESVSIDEYKPLSVKLRTVSTGTAILVLTDNYYPGWHAYIDGKETPIYRANYTFRAILLPGGLHEVRFSYYPASVKYGIAVSLLSCLTLAALYYAYPRNLHKRTGKWFR